MNVQSLVSRDYSNDWRSFATDLFKYEDADPGYLLLKRAKLDRATKLRYVMAWCTYYNPGIAAVACQYQGTEFWVYLYSMYNTAKRASERRHFRGKAGLKALNQWRTSRPEALIESTYGSTYLDVRKNMQGIPQMGDYFYWKLADIWDTVFDMPVDFTGCEKYMPKVPKQGAEIINGLLDRKYHPEVGAHDWLEDTMGTITKYLRSVWYAGKAPGVKLALQEAETVCCVFKQHVSGKHHMGTRTLKAWSRLQSVAHMSRNAVKLQEGLYAGGIWTPDRLIDLNRALNP